MIIQLPRKNRNSYNFARYLFFQSGTRIGVPAHFGTSISPWTCLSPFLPQFASLFTALHLPLVASTSIPEIQLMFAVHFEMTPGFKIKKQTTSYTLILVD
jgi:hypothetical protein